MAYEAKQFTGAVLPENKTIISSGDMVSPRVVSYKLEGVVTEAKARRLVTKGTKDHQVKVCGPNDEPCGWIDYEHTHAAYRPLDIATAYLVDSFPAICSGPMVAVGEYDGAVPLSKNDLLCPAADGKLRKYFPGAPQTITIDFAKSVTEVDTGIPLPTGAVVLGAFVEVETGVASAEIDVGILSSESGGDADGLLDGVDASTAGLIPAVTANTDTNLVTLGALLGTKIQSADGSPIFGMIPKDFVCDGVAKTISYTTTDHDIAGKIHVMFAAPGQSAMPCAKAEMSMTTAGPVAIRSLI